VRYPIRQECSVQRAAHDSTAAPAKLDAIDRWSPAPIDHRQLSQRTWARDRTRRV